MSLRLVTMDRIPKRGPKRQEIVSKRLEQFPHSFQLQFFGQDKHKAFESLQNDLKARLGRKVGYLSSLQTASVRNLLSFVLFHLHKEQEALEECEEVLKMADQKNNIVALANKAFLQSRPGSLEDPRESLAALHDLQDTPEYPYLLVKAKAELATSYMRFGPKFSQRTIDAFQDVLTEAREPEVWLWKYCLAVTYRKALGLQHATDLSDGQHSTTHEETLKLFKEILNSKPVAGEEESHSNLKANAYAEMGLLLRLTWDPKSEYDLCSRVEIGPLACCKTALSLDDNDPSVLWKSGKLFRNKQNPTEAKRLLEKSLRLQPSSAAFHHLGLTYKALATNVQHGKGKTRRAGKREQRRKKAMAFRSLQAKQENCPRSPGEPRKNTTGSCSGNQSQPSVTAKRIRKAVKSPNNATKFDPEDPNVKGAIEYLTKAVEFSAGENSRAAYDLALMYVATENVEMALYWFQSIAQRQSNDLSTPSGYLERITSLEQMGLIYKQKADTATDAGEKSKWIKKSERGFNDALSLVSEIYSTTSLVKNIFGEIFQSPRTLLKAAETSDSTDTEKQKIKANIFTLMNNHRQSLALLNDIAEEARDVDYFKLKIQAFAKGGEYGNAVATICFLEATKLCDEVMELLDQEEDGVYSVYNIYLEAGREALLNGPYRGGYFATAFRRAVQPEDPAGDSNIPSEDSSYSCGAIVSDKGSDDSQLKDVMLLHDEEDSDIEGKAVRLAHVLKTACGLRVVRRDENYLSGSSELGGLDKNIQNCRIVVVMPGNESAISTFTLCVSAAAMKESTVVLRTEGVGYEAVPLELRAPADRVEVCPAELLNPELDATGPLTPELASDVCRLFKFLTKRR